MFCGTQPIHKKEQNTDDYKKIEQYVYRTADKIGEGKFSKVYRGMNRQLGQPVAVKVIQYSTIKSKTASDLLKNEVSILKQLNHSNVIKCLDILTSQNNCYIVMEFYEGGDLQKLLIRHKRFDENEITKILYEVYKGLSYLNSHHIIHRDFKIANVFLTAQGNTKIGDFGFAVKATDQFKDIDIGSRIYMAPEAMLSKQYGPKTQVWAFGVMIYELLHGETPLSTCKTQSQLKQKILLPIRFRSNLSVEIRDLISQCLTVNPNNRISMKDIGDTAYMSKIIQQFQGYNIPKEMASTYYTSSSNCSQAFNLIKEIKNYEEAVAILQYCRLVHKTCQKIPSLTLSQWLLNISWHLQKSKPQGSYEKIEKFVVTAKDYFSKYKKQHKDSNFFVSGQQVKKECQKLQKTAIQTSLSQNITKSTISFLTMLSSETDMMWNALENGKLFQYAKSSQIQKFLENYKQTQNKNTHQKTGFGFYGVNY